MGAPECIVSFVLTGLKPEHLFENVQVVRDFKCVARILMTEKVIEVVKPCPCDGGQAHAARFVGAEKNQIAGGQTFLV